MSIAHATTHRRASVRSVIGEILLTVGVIAILFLSWQLWIGDALMSAAANSQGKSISEKWAQGQAPALPPIVSKASSAGESTRGSAVEPLQYSPPAMIPPENGIPWGAQMHVPRWGSDYNVQIAGGVTKADTLDHGWIGVYPGSGMPGQPGNFTMAAHRTTWGKPFNQLDKLRINDAIVIETAQGWYTYRFRTLEYVTPDSVEVLNPVPQQAVASPNGTYITMTACSPMYSMAERIVAFGVFDSFQPRALGLPSSLKDPVQ